MRVPVEQIIEENGVFLPYFVLFIDNLHLNMLLLLLLAGVQVI